MAHRHLSPETVDRDAVAKVAAQVQVRDIRFVVQHAALNCEYNDIPPDWTDDARIGFDCHLGEVNQERTSFTVHAAFFVAYWLQEERKPISEEQEEEVPPDVDISLILELEYHLKESSEISDEDLEHFAFLNSTFNAWPYFRQTVQSSTAQMGITPLLIPVQTVRPISVRT